EDNTVGVCFGSSGRPWAMMVFVRIDQDVFSVLMPAFNHVDSLDAYRSFAEEDEDRWLNVSEAVFKSEQGHWEACVKPFGAFWPKQSGTFDLDRQLRRPERIVGGRARAVPTGDSREGDRKWSGLARAG